MKKLVVKPIVTYEFFKRREKISWRAWGDIQNEKDLKEEVKRIKNELKSLKERADFPIEIQEISTLKDASEVDELKDADVLLIFPTSGPQSLLEKLVSLGKHNIFFIRYKSGPLYLWYEIIHPRFLREHTDKPLNPYFSIDDLVVDDYDEILWRLRALFALKNTIGKRVIAIGGPSGWGLFGYIYGPHNAKKIWKLDIVSVSYKELEDRLKSARKNSKLLVLVKKEAEDYLSDPKVTLKTNKKYVINAFLLYHVFKQILKDYDAEAITVKECMSTIMPIADTTACLVLSLLNDEGYLAFCESDFVVIPAGILLHYISGKPVFLNDPTTPFNGTVILAHCTAPRKMNGMTKERADIVTHFESDFGAAPKVYFKREQVVTVVDPDFSGKLWLGFKGRITDIPSHSICRSQVEVTIDGDWRLLLNKMRGFHWILCYGNYLREVSYAIKKLGIEWINVSTH